ncbi:unnamed protein product, partial [Mesorhabditis belari]|uniref:Uncharacterized protein n=1 Tax=Mesorhabditis belari TaxID=2138241 RepID=A0AAF3ESK6_9BILA
MDRPKKNNNGVVPMRLLANWDIDRTGNDVVQRICNLSVNRLQLNTFGTQIHNLVITAKLQGHKRTLRSNEIPITPQNGGLDVDLDITFNIQYPHFLKRKINVLQLLIQRRRKYKNRPIPGGFKTLAIGLVNLTQLLQQGTLREILLWNTDDLQKENSPNVQSIGRINFGICQTQPLDFEVTTNKEKGLGELSEDTESESEEEGEGAVDSDHQETPSGLNRNNNRMRENHMRNKLVHRKNLKQKIVSLLRKFKVPEEEETAYPPSASASVARAPTAKELEALFEELDDLSDSGPEGMAADEVSIGSNPRPGLQPYFSREKLPGLPAILDDRVSESEGEPEEVDWSSDAEFRRDRVVKDEDIEKIAYSEALPGPGLYHHVRKSSLTDTTNKITALPRASIQPTLSEKLGSSASRNTITHSLTAGSIATSGPSTPSASFSRETRREGAQRNASLGENILSMSETSILLSTNDCIWIYSPSDLPNGFSTPLKMIPCATLQSVKTILGQIVQKLHNFCNSNSSRPPLTWIGVLGNDKLIAYVLRAYVELVAHRSSSPFMSSIRFALIPPPNSLVGRLLLGLDSQLDCLSRDVWERCGDMNQIDLKILWERVEGWPKSNTSGCVNLPIGEALLQMPEKEGQSVDSSRLFVPFLAEVRVGQQDSEIEGSDSAVNSPREIEKESASPQSIFLSGSPPASPQNRHETQEMHVEYWLGQNSQEFGLSSLVSSSTTAQPLTPITKKEGKGSLKTNFRTLLITRACAQPLLSLTFVKEKRKEKMLHKLGMKNRQKSENENPPVQVGNLSRLLCSGTQKNSQLLVCVDGQMFPSVRFFQTSSQWPTHVRALPVALLSPIPSLSC